MHGKLTLNVLAALGMQEFREQLLFQRKTSLEECSCRCVTQCTSICLTVIILHCTIEMLNSLPHDQYDAITNTLCCS